MLRAGRIVLDRIRERRLPPPERRAAQIERSIERRLRRERRERDNDHGASPGTAASDAERRRQETLLGHRP